MSFERKYHVFLDVRRHAQREMISNGSKNLLHRAILYRHEKIPFIEGRRQAKRGCVLVGFPNHSLDGSICLGSCSVWRKIFVFPSADSSGRSGKIPEPEIR